MPNCKILYTFPSFLTFWNIVQHDSINMQMDAWLNEYMSQWPELLQKQLDDYASLNEDWRVTASERIFSVLPKRLEAMQTVHENLLSVVERV